MIIRNGVNSKLRARGRSLLFFFLILVLTLTMVLGYGVQLYCDSVLQRSDEVFQSIIRLEYLGIEYPDEDEADPQARKAYSYIREKNLEEIEGVKAWYPTVQGMYAAEGYTRYASPVPFSEYGILKVGHLGQLETKSEWKSVEGPVEETYVLMDIVNGAYLMADQGTITEYPYIIGNKKGLYEKKVFVNGEWVSEPVPNLPERCILEAPGSVIYEVTGQGSPISHVTKKVVLGMEGEDPLGDWPFYQYNSEIQVYAKEETYVAAYGSAIIQESLFSNDDPSNALIKIYLNNYDFQAEPQKEYLIHGYYGEWLQGVQSFYLDSFLWDSQQDPFIEDDETLPAYSYFLQTADLYKKANHGLMLAVCPDLTMLEVFHQKDLLVEEGRMPQEKGEILITPDIASKLGKKIGDLLELTALQCEESDRYHVKGTGETVKAEIVGITSRHADYVGRVWTSDPSFCSNVPFFGYTLGILHVENAKGPELVQKLNQSGDPLVHAVLMDQGYSEMVRPLQVMKMMARTVFGICVFGVLAVLILFAYLFVGKEKETLNILRSLGVSQRMSAVWVLSGAWVISASACLLGGLGGMVLLQKTIDLAMAAAEKMITSGTRFSEKYLGIVENQSVEVQLPLSGVLLAACVLFVISLLLCSVFLQVARRQGTPRRGKSRIRVPRSGTSVMGRGSLRFAMLSIQRGGGRTIVVPMVSAALSILIVTLCSIQQSWILEKERAYEETIIQGQLQSLNGQYHDQLVIPLDQAWRFVKKTNPETVSFSYGWRYWIAEEMPYFASNSFGQERRMAWIQSQPSLMAISDLTVGKDFYYGTPEIQWLEGWDEDIFVKQEYEPVDLAFSNEYAVLVGSTFAREHELQLGDHFFCDILGIFRENKLNLKVVGIYTQASSRSQLYVPISCAVQKEWIFGEEDRWTDVVVPEQVVTPQQAQIYLTKRMTLDSLRFTFGARQLENVRESLGEQGYSQVRRPAELRHAAVLQDAFFTNRIDDLNRQLTLSQMIFSMIFVLAALLAFVVSWLLINGRKTEFAIMRGLGASRLRVFASFFWEQAVLCLLGFGLGLISLCFLKVGGAMLWQALGAYLLSYFAGSALSVLLIGRMNLMELLTVRD